MVFTSVTSYLLVNLYFAESNPDDVLLLCDAEQVSKSTSNPDDVLLLCDAEQVSKSTSNPDDVLLLCDAEQVSKSTSDPDAAVVVVVVCVWCCGANFKTTKRIVKTS